tara:strand:+ start:99 stop:1397 length:1299 start_codon:yes stop_codon:yes gene_type:complete
MQYKNLLKKSIAVIGIKSLAAITSFLFVVAITRLLGAAESGVYFTIFSIVTITALAARSGLDQTILKLIPRSKEDKGLLYKQKKYFTTRTLLIGFGLAGALALLSYSSELNILALFNLNNNQLAFYAMLPAVIFLSSAMISANILKASSKPYTGSILESLSIPALTLALLPLLVTKYGTTGAGIAYTLSALVTCFTAILIVNKNIKKAYSGSQINLKEINASSRPLFVVTFLQLLIKEGPVLLAAITLSKTDVSMLAVATRLSLLITILLIATTTILAPIISQLYNEKKYVAVYSLISKATMVLSIFGLGVITIAIIIGQKFLGEAFGQEFKQAYIPMLLLMGGQLVNISTGPVQTLLIMSSNERLVKNSTIIYTICTLILTTISSFYGINQIALSICTTTSIYNIWLMRASYIKCGMCPFIFNRKHNENTV